MSTDNTIQDPLEFMKGMWGSMGFSLPGMVTPTLDVKEIDKRIGDLRSVENWLKMNLNMLQMSIQALEMQRATLSAMQAMSQSGAGETGANPFAGVALWPWSFLQPGAGGQWPQRDGSPADSPDKK